MNVNVTYSGYTLADAASCVMMRLPVPDLVWDMEALWKVWNEPLPAVDVPEAVPTDGKAAIIRSEKVSVDLYLLFRKKAWKEEEKWQQKM